MHDLLLADPVIHHVTRRLSISHTVGVPGSFLGLLTQLRASPAYAPPYAPYDEPHDEPDEPPLARLIIATAGRGDRLARIPATEPQVTPASPRVVTPAVQVRGILAERVIISTQLDPFLSLKALAVYSGLSVRTLREYLTDPENPLPCYRVGGKILVRRSEFDAWMIRYRQVGRIDVNRVVSDVLRDIQAT